MNKFITFLIIFPLFSCVTDNGSSGSKKGNLPAYNESYLYKPNEKLTPEKLVKYTKLELILMKTEIYARAGKLKGESWQKMYIKFRKWYEPGKNQELSKTAKQNINIINQEIEKRDLLVKKVARPVNLKFSRLYTYLKLKNKKKIKTLSNPITKSHWNYLLKKEYGSIKNNAELKKVMKLYKGSTGFYKTFVDNKNTIRLIIDYTGCCGVILGKHPRRVFIFSKDGRLLKKTKYFYDKKEEEWFYFYKNKELVKQIFIIYNISTGKIIEADVLTGNRIE